ncbi:MAG: hypothetical protein ACPGVU_10785 [Limisphaerales bacterium]
MGSSSEQKERERAKARLDAERRLPSDPTTLRRIVAVVSVLLLILFTLLLAEKL